MTQANNLGILKNSDVAGGDLLTLFSHRYGGDAALSLTVLSEFIQEQASESTTQAISATQYASPSATGFSVSILKSNTWLILTPSEGMASGTLYLPQATNRQEILVTCSQVVTLLNVTPNGTDSVLGAPSALNPNDYFRLKYDDVSETWHRVG